MNKCSARPALAATMITAIFIFLLMPAQYSAGKNPGKSGGSDITIFPGWGWVLETRTADLKSGRNEVTFPGIARQLDPGSLLIDMDGDIVSLRTRTEHQGWERIFRDLTGKQIRMVSETGQLVEGEVVEFTQGRLYLRKDGGRFMLIPNPHNYRLELAAMPDADKPGVQLDAVVNVDRSGSYPVRIFYVANGLSWGLDYSIVLNEAENRAAITGLAQIRNNSGTAWEDARVRLVAGDVRMSPRHSPHLRETGMDMDVMMARAEAMPDAEQYADHYVYQIPGRLDLPERELYQFPLVAAESVDVRKIYRHQVRPFSGTSEEPRRLDIVYAFQNLEDQGLGKPMPAGTVRVYRKTGVDEAGRPDSGTAGTAGDVPSSGGMQLLGQDRIPHVAKSDRFEVMTGRAFDVRAVETLVRHEQVAPRVREESREIALKNEKKEKVTATVVIPLHRNLTVVNESHRPVTETADRRVYEIEIPAEGEATLRITIRQSN
jgi:hypothetical protein